MWNITAVFLCFGIAFLYLKYFNIYKIVSIITILYIIISLFLSHLSFGDCILYLTIAITGIHHSIQKHKQH